MHRRELLVLAATASVLGCRGQQSQAGADAGASTVSISPSASAQPTYEDGDFAIRLPGSWRKQSGNRLDLVTFRDAAGKQQLTVSVMPFKDPASVDASERLATASRLLDRRVEAERKAVAPADVSLEVTARPEASSAIGSFRGSERPSGRKFLSYVTVGRRAAVVLYLESFSSDDEALRRLGAEILGGLTLKG